MAADSSSSSGGKRPASSSTYMERFVQYLHMTDPRNLKFTDAQARDALQKVATKDFSLQSAAHYDEVIRNTVNSSTGDVIPTLFRMSAIAPANIPIVMAMIACPATNVAGTMFLHVLNQSYNSACNYYNRSGADMDMAAMAKAYSLAVTSACVFAAGLGALATRAPPAWRVVASVAIPCVATAGANMSNVALTRIGELQDGAAVRDADGQSHGLSKTAGFMAVGQTAVTRCAIVPCTVLLLPPILLSALRRTPLSRVLFASARRTMAVELAAIYLCLQAALPASLAIFPQEMVFLRSELEPEFQDCTDAEGRPVLTFYGSKGL